MTHQARTATVAVAVIAAALFVPEAAAQAQVPAAASWHALPYVVPQGATVLVRTRDGNTTKGRFRSLSDTAIVLESGELRTIPAAAVLSVEGGGGRRPVTRFAGIGAGAGLMSALLLVMAAGPQDTPCSTPDECANRGKAVYTTALALPAVGAGIGAIVGALTPVRRALSYSAPGGANVSLAPFASGRRRGAAVRVAF